MNTNASKEHESPWWILSNLCWNPYAITTHYRSLLARCFRCMLVYLSWELWRKLNLLEFVSIFICGQKPCSCASKQPPTYSVKEVCQFIRPRPRPLRPSLCKPEPHCQRMLYKANRIGLAITPGKITVPCNWPNNILFFKYWQLCSMAEVS